MSIIFSRQCEYALQAVFFMALKKVDSTTSIRELTERLHTPYFFMAKILQDLSRKGLLTSYKGPTGGFTLAKAPKDITLIDIIDAIDGEGILNECVLGFPECSAENPCALHEHWAKSRDAMYDVLTKKTIAQMAAAMKKPEYSKVVSSKSQVAPSRK